MRALVVGVLLVVESATGCTPPRPINVMHDSAPCDSLPPALTPGERTGGELPRGIAADAGAGSVIGIVLQSGSGRPIAGATVILRPMSSSSASDTITRRVITGIGGGFAFPPVVPTRYELRVSHIAHWPRIRELTPRAS